MGETVREAWASDDTNGTSSPPVRSSSAPLVDLADAGWSLGGNGTQGSLRTYAHCARCSAASTEAVTEAQDSAGRAVLPPAVVGDLPPGAVALFMLNLDQREGEVRRVEVSVDGSSSKSKAGNNHNRGGSSDGDDQLRYEWHLTSGPEGSPLDLTTHETWLNGELLSLDPATGALPLPLEPQTQLATSPVELASASAVFLILPDAGAAGCM